MNSNILLFIEADYKNKILFFLLEKESLSCVLSISFLLKHGKIIFKQSRELNKKSVGVCTEKLVEKIEKHIF